MICIKFFGDQPSTMNHLDVESDVGEKTRVIDHYFRENLLIHVIFIKIWENHIFISFISMFFPFIYHYDIIFLGKLWVFQGFTMAFPPPLFVSRIPRSRQEENRPRGEGNDSENLGQPRFQAPNESFTAKK